MNQTKVVKLHNISFSPRSRNSFSSSTSSGYRSFGETEWTIMSDELMKLNEKNFAKFSKTIITKLQTIIQNGASVTQTGAVLYILYERSVREVITKSFPISANLIDTLTTSCSDSVFEIIQPLLQEHLKRLQMKLRSCAVLKGQDVGAIFLLLNMYKLDKMASRTASPIVGVMEQIIDDTANYIEFLGTKEQRCNDALITLLFCLISYTLLSDDSNKDIDMLKTFVRDSLVKDKGSLSKLAKVLAVDIIEQTKNNGVLIPLYAAIYKKIIASGKFILAGVVECLIDTPFPDNVESSIKISVEDDELIDDVFTSRTNSPLSSGYSSCDVTPRQVNSCEVTPRTKSRPEPDGQSDDDKKHFFKDRDIKSPATTPTSEKNILDRKPSWTRSISQIQKENVTKASENIEIPERYLARVTGYEGAILRKLELQSGAIITILEDDDQDQGKEPAKRPSTSSLSAHRLITGALGISAKHPFEKIEEERLNYAKVKRQYGDNSDEQNKQLTLTGSEEEIIKAKKLITDIITCIVTEKVSLDYSVNEIVDKYSTKLKTFETLLNVYLEIEEVDNHKVLLTITGDEKSCKDCKKLVFEELGSFRSQHGHLFYVPSELMKCLIDGAGVKTMIKCVQSITGARIIFMRAFQDYGIFISGYPVQVSGAMQIFQKTNIELLCSLSSLPSGSEFTVDDICDYINEKFSRRQSTNTLNQSSPSLMKKFQIVADEKPKRKYHRYTREELMELSKCGKANIFPEQLVDLLQNDPSMECMFRDRLLLKEANDIQQTDSMKLRTTQTDTCENQYQSVPISIKSSVVTIPHQSKPSSEYQVSSKTTCSGPAFAAGQKCQISKTVQAECNDNDKSDEINATSSESSEDMLKDHVKEKSATEIVNITTSQDIESSLNNSSNLHTKRVDDKFAITTSQDIVPSLNGNSNLPTKRVDDKFAITTSQGISPLLKGSSNLHTKRVDDNFARGIFKAKRNYSSGVKENIAPYPGIIGEGRKTIPTLQNSNPGIANAQTYSSSSSYYQSSATAIHGYPLSVVQPLLPGPFADADQHRNTAGYTPTLMNINGCPQKQPLLPGPFTGADQHRNTTVYTPTLMNINGCPQIRYQVFPVVHLSQKQTSSWNYNLF